MRAILVGAGGVSRELLRRLGDMWEVTVVDTSSERLARAGWIRSISKLEGDGSSRVVLERAGLSDSDALIALSDDDDVNLEACRLAREAGVPRLAALARNPERLHDYRALGVSAEAADTLVARRIELGLESRRVSSMAFAGGKAEAIEFQIEQNSPVRGKALKEIAAESFIVGAVLRRDELIIPHGDTRLEEGDTVTVVGAGTEFAALVRTFAAGEQRFPLDYGKRVAFALDADPEEGGVAEEALYLVRNSQASALVAVHRERSALRDEMQATQLEARIARLTELAQGVEVKFREVPAAPARSLAALPESESIGALVVPGVVEGGFASWQSARLALRLCRRSKRPVLLARGSHPYERILVPARHTPAGHAAARIGVDLARKSKARLVGLSVADPVFLAGQGAPREARQAINWLEEEAGLQGVRVEGRIERGNPVRTFRSVGEDADLLVVGVPPRRDGGTSLRLGLAGLIAHHARPSTLLVPLAEKG